MSDNILCFTLGLNKDDINKCIKSFTDRAALKPGPGLNLCPVTDKIFNLKVSDVIANIQTHLEKKGDAKLIGSPYRAILINSNSKDQVLAILRSFKKVLPQPNNVIFAMITDTARTWTFDYYAGHLVEEHEYMKTHSPAKDPDMKKI